MSIQGRGLVLVLAVVAGAWLVAGLGLRERSPRWYWLLVGYPVCWVRMSYTWRSLCVECGLTTVRRSGAAVVGDLIVRGQQLRPVVPRLWIGGPRGTGLTARVRLLPGQTPEQYAAAGVAMMHAWRVHSVRVDSRVRGFVHITVLTSDPLSGVVVRDPVRAVPAGGDVGGAPSLALVIGVREDGLPWVLDLRRVPHWLIVGATRSGKSTLMHAVIVRLAPLPVAIVGVDLKGGLELSAYGPRLAALAVTRGEAAELFSRLLVLIAGRMCECRAAGVRSIWDLPRVPPPVVVVVDEVAELYLVGDRSEKDVRERAAVALLRLAQLGAALGVHLLIGGQRVGSDLGQGLTALRAQLGGRICHHVSDPETATMALGDLYPEAVVSAQMITAEHQGYAITTDGEGGWMRARSTFTSPQEAADAANRFAHLAPTVPGLTQAVDAAGGDAS